MNEKLRSNPYENLIASAQKGCLPEGFSQLYLEASFPDRENIINILFNEYLRKNQVTKDRIQRFIRILDYTFPKRINLQEHTFIKKSLKIATVAHQYNREEKRRVRKSDQTPYIFHSTTMAELLLRSKFDAFTIAATLLHDVPEDANLGEGLNKASDWLTLIQDEFNFTTKNISTFGIEQNRKAGDLLEELIDGATEKVVPQKRTELKKLRASPFHKMLTAYVQRGGVKVGRRRRGSRSLQMQERILSQEDQKVIDEVAYNLKELFDRALQSPDHWRIFFIKIADVWHNLQTPEWVKQAKILRGRIAAGLAEWLGWFEVRSDLVQMLTPITNMLTPYKPMTDPYKLPFPRDYKEIEKLARYPPYIGEEMKKLSKNPEFKYHSLIGWPIVYTDKPYKTGVNESSLPLPEIILSLEEKDFETIDAFLPRTKDSYNRRRDFRSKLPSDTPSKEESTHYIPYFSETALLEKALGRRRLDYLVKIRSKNSFLLRLETNQPYIRNVFEKGESATIDQVPEAALFNNFLKERSLAVWDFHVASLVAFLYTPSLPVNLGENVYLLKVGNKMLFIDGQTFVGSLLTLLGKEVAGTKGMITLRNAYMNEVQLYLGRPLGGPALGGRRRQISARIVFFP